MIPKIFVFALMIVVVATNNTTLVKNNKTLGMYDGVSLVDVWRPEEKQHLHFRKQK
jgi:hypothetical protein